MFVKEGRLGSDGAEETGGGGMQSKERKDRPGASVPSAESGESAHAGRHKRRGKGKGMQAQRLA